MMALIKNSEHTVEIMGYTSEGAGITRIDGQVVFIPCTIMGEICRIKIIKVIKNIAYGRLIQVEKASTNRREPECTAYPQCGGCDFWHMNYEAELHVKQQRVEDAMRRIGGQDVKVSKIVGAPQIMRYRNKAQFPVAMASNKVVSGFYRAHSHDIVPCNDCKIQSELANTICTTVLAWMEAHNITPYDEKNGKGIVRHIYVRKTMLCLVVTKKPLHLQELVDSVLKNHPQVSGILLNYNADKTNVILGRRCETIWGNENVEDSLCENRFLIAPHAFYQVNHDQAERLYQIAIDAAELHGDETVLDLYCGAGTITLALAKHAKYVIGVEIVVQAVENARENAQRNGLTNVEFICADAADAAKQLEERGIKADVVVVDPPRKGLSPDLIDTIERIAPKRLVYVSCDPATLARDLKILNNKNFATQTITPVDMFPRTRHVETVVLMSRVDK